MSDTRLVRFTPSQVGWMREAFRRSRPWVARAARLRAEADRLQKKADALVQAVYEGVLAEQALPASWEVVVDTTDESRIPIGIRSTAPEHEKTSSHTCETPSDHQPGGAP